MKSSKYNIDLDLSIRTLALSPSNCRAGWDLARSRVFSQELDWLDCVFIIYNRLYWLGTTCSSAQTKSIKQA